MSGFRLVALDEAESGRLRIRIERRGVRRYTCSACGRATRAAADEFVQRHYRRRYSRYASPLPRPSVTVVPPNFGSRRIGVRLRLRLTQAELARRIVAANKAVGYQWESGKRTPSPPFWLRIEQLAASDGARTALGWPDLSVS